MFGDGVFSGAILVSGYVFPIKRFSRKHPEFGWLRIIKGRNVGNFGREYRNWRPTWANQKTRLYIP